MPTLLARYARPPHTHTTARRRVRWPAAELVWVAWVVWDVWDVARDVAWDLVWVRLGSHRGPWATRAASGAICRGWDAACTLGPGEAPL